MKRLIVVDVDGTLTDEKGNIHSRVVKKLEELRDAGYDVILSSGNGYVILVGLAYYLPVKRFVIAENGGVIGYRKDMKILGNPSIALKAREKILKLKGDIIVESWQNRYRIVDLAFRPKPGTLSLEEAYKVIQCLLKDEKEVRVENSGWAIHVRDASIDKGKGLLVTCLSLGYDVKEAIAIGDSITDLSMFKVAGFSIAVANSPEILKKTASFVTVSSYHEGFIEAANYILKNF